MLLFINDAGLIISCMHGHAPDLTRMDLIPLSDMQPVIGLNYLFGFEILLHIIGAGWNFLQCKSE